MRPRSTGRCEHAWSAKADGWTSPTCSIASIALSRGLTVVTGNVRHFARVPDLAVENWLVEEPPQPA